MTLHDLEREIIALRTENASLKAAFGQERQRTQSHENKIVVHESAIDQLNKKLKNRDNEIRNLQTQLNQKQQLLNQKELEKEKQKKRLNCKFAVEREKIESELETKLQQQKNEMHVRGELIACIGLVVSNCTNHPNDCLCRIKCATKRTSFNAWRTSSTRTRRPARCRRFRCHRCCPNVRHRERCPNCSRYTTRPVVPRLRFLPPG